MSSSNETTADSLSTAPRANGTFCPQTRRKFVLIAAILASALGFIDGSVLAIAMPWKWELRWAPLGLGGLWAVTLLLIAQHLRRLRSYPAFNWAQPLDGLSAGDQMALRRAWAPSR